MIAYRDRTGRSGVRAYEPGPGCISVEFKDGSIYCYTNDSTGGANIEQMKVLAAAGQGLNTFINQHVRKSYAKRGPC